MELASRSHRHPYLVSGRSPGDLEEPAAVAGVTDAEPAAAALESVLRPRAAGTDARLSPAMVAHLQGVAGNAAVQRLVASDRDRVQRQQHGTGTTTAPPPPVTSGATLSAAEAADRVSLRLFGTAGYFQGARNQLDNFQRDMMQLGWYAGERQQAAEAHGPVSTALRDQATDFAKTKGEKVLEILITGVTVGAAGAGPAGAAAGVVVAIIGSVLSDLHAFRPVITQLAQKPVHQVYAEGLIAVVREAQRRLEDRWTSQRDETVAQAGVAGLERYAEQIRQATALVESTYYPELVAGYLPLAPGRTVELPTPHAVYTGEGRGFTPFVGSSHYVSQVRGRDIYVELAASDFVPANMRIVRTLVPELPSTVLDRLNDPSETQGQILSLLPMRRLVMEATTSIGPARVVFDMGSASFDVPMTPHFSREFCRRIGQQMAGGGLDHTRGEGALSEQQFAGAVGLYGTIIGKPLSAMKFQA